MLNDGWDVVVVLWCVLLSWVVMLVMDSVVLVFLNIVMVLSCVGFGVVVVWVVVYVMVSVVSSRSNL